MRGHLTGRDVRDVVFRKPPIGSRGYDEGEVDALLDRVSDALEAWAGGLPARLTAVEVRDATLPTAPIGRRGYRTTEVDDFLDRAVATLARWEGVDPAALGDGRGGADARSDNDRGSEATPGLVERPRGFWRRLFR